VGGAAVVGGVRRRRHEALMLGVNSPIVASYGVVREDGLVICDINADDQQQVRAVSSSSRF